MVKFNLKDKSGGDDELITSVPTDASKDKQLVSDKNKKQIVTVIICIVMIIIVLFILKNKMSMFDGNKVTKQLRSDAQSSSWNLKDRIDKLLDRQNKYYNL